MKRGRSELIEWLASKIGVLIAIGVITIFVLGLFSWQHSVAVDLEGQSIADSISGIIDDIGNLDAVTMVNVSFGMEGGQLPGTIGGEEYRLNITRDSVIIISGHRTWMSKFVIEALPQNLSTRTFNLTEIESLDCASFTGEHDSAGSFTIETQV